MTSAAARTADVDVQDLAFEALLPLAEPTERALQRVQSRLESEIKLVGPLREGLHVVQRAALNGLARFAHGVLELGEEYANVTTARRSSTPQQEEQNIYLWTVDERFMLRVKRDPVDRVDPGTQRLFSQLPAGDRPVQVFLTWDVSETGQIIDATFACLEEPKWTISVARLVAHTVASAPALATPQRKALVQSARPEASAPALPQAEEHAERR